MSAGSDQYREGFGETLSKVFDDHPLTGGEFQFVEVNDCVLIVQPFEETAAGQVHLMTISRGIVPPDEVQQLPYGIVSPDNQILCAGRTGDCGEVRATLPPGEFRIRFVPGNDSTNSLDQQILQRISDDAGERPDANLLAAATQAVLTVFGNGRASGEPLRQLPRPRNRTWTCGLMTTSQTAARTAGTAKPIELGTCERIGGNVALYYDTDDWPYAVALAFVFDVASESELVACRFLAVPRTESYRRDNVSLEVFGALPEKGELRFELLPANDENLPLFKSKAAVAEIEQLRSASVGSLREELDQFLAVISTED